MGTPAIESLLQLFEEQLLLVTFSMIPFLREVVALLNSKFSSNQNPSYKIKEIDQQQLERARVGSKLKVYETITVSSLFQVLCLVVFEVMIFSGVSGTHTISQTISFFYKESVVYPFIINFETMGNFYILTAEDFCEIIAYAEHHGMISLWCSDLLLHFLLYFT